LNLMRIQTNLNFQFYLLFIFLLISHSEANSQSMISESAKRGIVRIETPESKLGTGFIVLDTTSKALLVTSKHVLKSCVTHDYFDHVYLRKNALLSGSHVVATDERSIVHLRYKGQDLFVEDKDPNVDLAIVLLGKIELKDTTIENSPISTSYWYYGFKSSLIAKREDMTRLNLETGTPVQLIGFSHQQLQKPQFHVSRFGHIALFTFEKLVEVFKSTCDTLHQDTLSSEWLVLDMTARGGDSGGPVLARLGNAGEVFLIGIVKGGDYF
jgi:hypothetical protein